MKKLIALVLALALVLAVAAASANTITVNNAKEGETYVAYKMLDLSHQGTDAAGNPTAYRYTVNSEWTGFFNVNNSVVTAVFSIDDDGYVTSRASSETAWSPTSDLSAFAEAAADYARAHSDTLTAADTKTVAASATSTTLTTGDGYYLITSTLGTRAMIDTTPGNVTINEKNEGDTIVKTVKEDSTGDFGASNDAQVGDTVEFKSVATISPRSVNVKIHDTMDDGLTLNTGSIAVYTDEAKQHQYTGATIRTAASGDGARDTGDSFTIDIPDSFAASATSNLTLYVYYTAEVNAAAIVVDPQTGVPAIDPQTNRTTVSFGRDSHSTEDHTDTTTHKFAVLKYKTGDTTKAHLANAIFEVKKNGTTLKLKKIDANNYRIADDTETGAATTHVAANNEVATVAAGSLVSDFVTVASGNIVIWGVDDDDDYSLHEIQAPKGYNLVADTDVNIEADNSTVVEIGNATGTELPSTGGIGTTIFYILGGLLVVGAAVILVARRKASN